MYNITQSQTDTIIGYKGSDSMQEDMNTLIDTNYSGLVAFDISTLAQPVTLTDEESRLLNDMEEAQELIKMEAEEKATKAAGAATLAFFDLNNMGRHT